MILINLLPQELRKKEVTRIVMPEIPIKKTLIAIGAALAALQILLTLVAVFFSLREAAVKHEITILTSQTQETHQFRTQTLTVLNKLKDIHALTDKKFYWASVLNAISESLTKGVWLRGLSLDEVIEETPRVADASVKANAGKKSQSKNQTIRVMKLEGSVTASGQETAFIGKYVKSLKENPYLTELFRDVELANINQRKIKEFDVYDFILLCKFRKGKI